MACYRLLEDFSSCRKNDSSIHGRNIPSYGGKGPGKPVKWSKRFWSTRIAARMVNQIWNFNLAIWSCLAASGRWLSCQLQRLANLHELGYLIFHTRNILWDAGYTISSLKSLTSSSIVSSQQQRKLKPSTTRNTKYSTRLKGEVDSQASLDLGTLWISRSLPSSTQSKTSSRSRFERIATHPPLHLFV